MNQQVSELADTNRISLLKQQAEELKEYMSILKDTQKLNPVSARYAISGLENLGIQGEFGWNNTDWTEAIQEQLNRIASELWKIEDAKRRISVPTEMDVRQEEVQLSYRAVGGGEQRIRDLCRKPHESYKKMEGCGKEIQ